MKRFLFVLCVVLLTGCSTNYNKDNVDLGIDEIETESVEYIDLDISDFFGSEDLKSWTLKFNLDYKEDKNFCDILIKYNNSSAYITGIVKEVPLTLFIKDNITYKKINGTWYIVDNIDLSDLNPYIFIQNAKVLSLDNGVYSGEIHISNLLGVLEDKLKLDLEYFSASWDKTNKSIVLSEDGIELRLKFTDLNKTVIDDVGDLLDKLKSGDEIETESIDFSDTLMYYCFGKKIDKAYLEEAIKNYNIFKPSDAIYDEIFNFLLNYTADDFMSELNGYNDWSNDKKQALAYLIKLGALNVNSIYKSGIDFSEIADIVNKL